MALAPLKTLLAAIAGPKKAQKSGWEGRLKRGSYKAPSGVEIAFDYEDVSREITKRGTAFEFPGVDGAYVQQSGFGPRRYPLRCFFSGSDCDLIATAFEVALLEKGTGTLTHPLYGVIDVVPFGDITRRDDLVTEANQAVVDVTFWTTLGAVYPTGQGDPKNELLGALDGFDVAAAQRFAQMIDLKGAKKKSDGIGTIKSFLHDVSATLSDVAAATASVDREFRSLQRDINAGIDVLIGQPLLLAQQISNLISAPSRALAGIVSRLEGYGLLADRIFGSSSSTRSLKSATLDALRTRLTNNLFTADHFAMTAVAGSMRSVVANKFETRRDAAAAAAAVFDQFDALIAWREEQYAGLAQLDTGESYQALQKAVALVAGYLIEISFTLIPERRIVLDRARTIIDLAAELYGDVDEHLDYLIRTNNLTGSEILELQRGRVIVYYDPNADR